MKKLKQYKVTWKLKSVVVKTDSFESAATCADALLQHSVAFVTELDKNGKKVGKPVEMHRVIGWAGIEKKPK